jgi:outer membrane lipoprotein-sorting protein
MRKSSAALSIFNNTGRVRVLPALLLFLVVSGCAALRPASREYPAVPPIKEPLALLRKIMSGNESLQHVSALSRIKITSPRGSLNVKGAVIARAPGCIRLEMFAFLNQLAFLFATDGSVMSFFLPAQNSFYTGKAADEYLSILYGTGLRLQDATALFLGYPRILPFEAAHINCKSDAGQYLFDLPSAEGSRQHVFFDPMLQKITKYMLYNAAGDPLYLFSFANFKAAGTNSFPNAIELTFFQSQTRITMTCSDIDSNLVPDAGLFTIAAPARAKKLPLEALAQNRLMQAD